MAVESSDTQQCGKTSNRQGPVGNASSKSPALIMLALRSLFLIRSLVKPNLFFVVNVYVCENKVCKASVCTEGVSI